MTEQASRNPEEVLDCAAHADHDAARGRDGDDRRARRFAGTRGYDDLRRDALAIPLADGLEVTVASLVDLVRIAEASEGRARVPALRRTLELAAAASAAPAA